MAGAILALRVSWPGFTTWQPQVTTYTPAGSAGQSLVLEFDHPSVVNFSAAFANASESQGPGLLAQVTVIAPSPSIYVDLPVRVDRSLGQIQVRLDGVQVGAGSRIAIKFSDPNGEVLIGGTEHDSFASGSRMVGGGVVGGDLAFRVVYRRSIGSLVLDGLRIALQSWRLALAVCVAVGAAGLLTSGTIRRLKALDLGALISVGISGGLLLTSLIGLAAGILRLQMTPTMVLLLALVLGLPGLWLWFRPRGLSPRLDFGAFGLVTCLLLFGALRLAFASPLILPAHVDSVQQYLAVTDLLAPKRPPLAANIVGDFSARYYHLGFHALAAWVLALAGMRTPLSLLVLGQVIQTALIGAVYFPVYAAVRDAKAGVAAVALAGLGWSMPAYASNWAKYPAILGLAVLPFACGLTLLALHGNGRRRFYLLLASGMAVFGAMLIHTRMLFLFAAFMLSIEVARRFQESELQPGVRARTLIPIAILLLLALTLILVSSPASLDALRQSMTIFVDAQGVLSTVAVLALAPLAFRQHRTAAVAAIASIGLILLFELLPPNAAYPFPIVDAPLARMSLFLPLSFLGGLGVSAIGSSLHAVPMRAPMQVIVIGVIAFVVILYVGGAMATQSYSPDECCVLARQDDVNIARAASVQLPSDSVVLIPTRASADVQSGPYPVDGGAWLFALSGRHTAEWPAEDDLASASQHSLLCSRGITHVYSGGTPWGFSREELDLAPGFYAPDLVLPGAAIYSVDGCR